MTHFKPFSQPTFHKKRKPHSPRKHITFRNSSMSFHVSVLTRRTLPLEQPETKRFPWSNATAQTSSLWPRNRLTSCPVTVLQMSTVLSLDPEAKKLSWLNATVLTLSSWPSRSFSKWPLVVFQMRTVPSWDPVANKSVWLRAIGVNSWLPSPSNVFAIWNPSFLNSFC